jgi:hypothetical protein
VDRHLRAVFDGLVTALYLTKQMVWAVSPAWRRDRLRDLLAYLIEQSHLVDEAEARFDGRAPGMAAPSSHERRNVLGEVRNDLQAALAVYTEHVTDLASDMRRRAADMGDADESKLLLAIAAGLQTRLADLEGPE